MSNVDSALAGSYEPAAIYFGDSDCLEYVKADDFCLYERVDEFLTLVRGIDGETLVGFKLKGFRNRFDRLLGVASLGDDEFLHIMRAIENICSEIGHNLTRDPRRQAAYKAAYDLAANDNVRLDKRELRAA